MRLSNDHDGKGATANRRYAGELGDFMKFDCQDCIWNSSSAAVAELKRLGVMGRGSIIVALLAWGFLIWQFLLSMAAPDWLAALTLCGFVLCVLASLILSWLEKKRHRSSWRFGFWLGIGALVAFAVAMILPAI